MISEVANVVGECLKKPLRPSVWSVALGRYVCVDTPEGKQALRERDQVPYGNVLPPLMGSYFKLVFLTAAIGTLLFLVLCIVVTLAAGKDPPPLLDRVVNSTMDLVKVGFGAIVGLLGGKVSAGPQSAASTR